MIIALSLSPCIDKVYRINNFKPGKLFRIEDVIKTAGGKGINVSRVSRLLGSDVILLGFLAGTNGHFIHDKVKLHGIHANFIEVEGESRTNNNIIDKSSGLETEILEVGPLISDYKKNEFLKVFKKTLIDNSVLICSGGLPKGINTDFYKDLINIANEKNIKTVLDTSKECLIEGIKAKPYLIKPNLRELKEITGKNLESDSEIINAVAQILKAGVKNIIVSLGSKGAFYISKNLILKASIPVIKYVNSIGSGDSMTAGLAVALESSFDAYKMLKLGCACGMSNSMFWEIGFIDKEKTKEYIDKIIVNEVRV